MASKGRLGVRVVLVVALWLSSTALAAGQSPVPVYLPLVTNGEEAEPVPVIPQQEPPQEEPDEVTPDSRAYDGDAEPSAVLDGAIVPEAFSATQWTVQNNLGIGTQTPATRIDIAHSANSAARIQVRSTSAGANAAAELYLSTGSSQGVLLKKFGPGSTANWDALPMANWTRLRTDAGSHGLILTTGSNNPIILGTADRERVRITRDGRIIIGTRTSNTAMRMHVDGGDLLRGIYVTNALGAGVVVDNASGHGVEINAPTSYGVAISSPGIYGVRVGTPGTDGIYVYNPGQTGLRVDGAGGIGTQQHGVYVFDVNADGFFVESAGRYGLHTKGGASDAIVAETPGGSGMAVYSPGGHGYYVSGSTYDGVFVNTPGDDGMQVVCPCGSGNGVHVSAGHIRVTGGSFIDDGVIVADYVFEPDYPLMPLAELRAYVEEEKHLPNVPDADDVAAEGLDLGEFQMKLLEKVEELTLYTLAQDEQIEALQRQNAELEARLAALEEKLAGGE